jgi:beta-carotene 3-hydroxylase
MSVLINISLFVAALAGMELVAYLSHRYVMHGALWSLHESHHVSRPGWFEKNDLFGVFFAIPSIVLIYLGVNHVSPLLWVGLGMTGYGVAYFVFHDVIVHRRVKLPYKPKSKYMRRIMQAHRMHHATRGRDGAVSFGFLYAPTLDRLKLQRDRIAQERGL